MPCLSLRFSLLSLSILLFDAGEDHTSGGGLEDFRNHDFFLFTDVIMTIFTDDDGAVIHVAHALTELLAFLEDVQGHALAR